MPLLPFFQSVYYRIPRQRKTEPRAHMCHFLNVWYNHGRDYYKLLDGETERVVYSREVTGCADGEVEGYLQPRTKAFACRRDTSASTLSRARNAVPSTSHGASARAYFRDNANAMGQSEVPAPTPPAAL